MYTETFSFEKLDVYQAARDLVKQIYLIQKTFPKEETFALANQIRRASVSITTNIAEGCGRTTPGEKKYFIGVAFGSMTETFSELLTAQDLGYVTPETVDELRPRFQYIA